MNRLDSSTPNARWLWLLLVVVVIWFGNLEYRTLIKPDEGRYAEIPREMAVSGDWVTPRLNGLKYFEKPALQYWATAAAYKAFGQHQWTARLWPALTGFAGILLIVFVGWRLFGASAGLYAAALLGSSQLYVGMAHLNTLDMGVTFFLTLGVCGLLLAQQPNVEARARRNWMCLAWVALALAVLSKGLIGLVLPGAALVLYSLITRDIGLWRRMHWGVGLLLFFLVAAPWFYLVMQANPEFFDKFFIYEHFTRFATKAAQRYQPWWFFIPVVLLGMLPWTLLLIDTLRHAWKDAAPAAASPASGVAKTFNPERFLLVWSVFVFIFFSLSDSKLIPYVLPIFPALALLMGKRLAAMETRRLFWLLAPLALAPLLVLGVAPFSERFADLPQERQLYGEYARWLAAAALFWLAGLVAALFLLRRARKTAAVLTLALGALIAAQLGASGYNTIAQMRSADKVAAAIRPYVTLDIPFYSVHMYEQTLPFYLNRTLTLVGYKGELEFGIEQDPHLWLPDIAALAKVWQTQPEALAIMWTDIYPAMQQAGLTMQIIYQDSQYIVVKKP